MFDHMRPHATRQAEAISFDRATVRLQQQDMDQSALGAMEPTAGRVTAPGYNGSRRGGELLDC